MKSRSFHAKMFNDSYIQGLTLAERWIYTYYLFNERVNWVGCYEVTDRTVLFEAGEGISQETLKKAKQKFQKDNKIIFAGNFAILRNSEKYEAHMNNIQLMGSALKQFKALPDEVKDAFLKVKPQEVIEAYRASFERIGYNLQVDYSVGYNVEYTVDEGKGKEEIINNNKGEYEGEKPKTYRHIDDIGLSEVEELTVTLGVGKQDIVTCIQELEDYCASTGKSYKDYLATLRNWVRRKKGEGKIRPAKSYPQPSEEGSRAFSPNMRHELASKLSMP